MQNREVTIRRNLQQLLHCCQEALSVVEAGEDPLLAIEDLDHAGDLLKSVRRCLAQERDQYRQAG